MTLNTIDLSSKLRFIEACDSGTNLNTVTPRLTTQVISHFPRVIKATVVREVLPRASLGMR